jgi:ankyrin repeat protein
MATLIQFWKENSVFGLSQREKDDALFHALYYGRVNQVIKALEKGANPNYDNRDYGAPIIHACRMRDEDTRAACIEALLAKGADVKKTDGEGQTALHCVMMRGYGSLEGLEKLLAAGAEVDARDRAGNTPLMVAMNNGLWECAEKLLAVGADPKAQNKSGRTMLMAAIERNAPITLLDKLQGQDVNKAEKGGQPPLVRATVNGSKKNISWLLKQPRIEIDKPGPIEPSNDRGPTVNRSALQQAVVLDKKELCEVLLQAGAKVDLADGQGQTPLCAAVAADNHDMVELLVKGKAKLSLPGIGGQAALEIAARNGSIRMVKTLLTAAEAANEKLALEPALTAAAEKGHGRVLELLITAGGDVNAADDDARTPLMKAALSDQIEVLSILVKAGAKTDAADRHGMQAYDHAVSNGKGKAKEYLSRYRSGKVKADTPAPTTTVSDDYRFTRLNDHSLEVREGESLTMTFNFWTQQVIFRDTERPAPVTVQNFGEIQRQEAIEEAYRKLKELGGNPPEPGTLSVAKRLSIQKP